MGVKLYCVFPSCNEIVKAMYDIKGYVRLFKIK